MLIFALLLAAGVAGQDGGVVAKQTTLSIDEVLGGKTKPKKALSEAERETERHNRKMEDEFRKLSKGRSAFSLQGNRDAFAFGHSKQRRARPTRSLPSNSTSY